MMKCDVFQRRNEEKRRKENQKIWGGIPLIYCWKRIAKLVTQKFGTIQQFLQIFGIMLGKMVDGLPVSPVEVDAWLPLTVKAPDEKRESGNGKRKTPL